MNSGNLNIDLSEKIPTYFRNDFWGVFKIFLSFCFTLPRNAPDVTPIHTRGVKVGLPATAQVKSPVSSCPQGRNVNKHLMHLLSIWISLRRIMWCVLWMLLYLNQSAYVSDMFRCEIQMSLQDKQKCYEPPLRQAAVTRASMNGYHQTIQNANRRPDLGTRRHSGRH